MTDSILWVHGSAAVDGTVNDSEHWSGTDLIVIQRHLDGAYIRSDMEGVLDEDLRVVLPLVLPTRIDEDLQLLNSVRVLGSVVKDVMLRQVDIVAVDASTRAQTIVGSTGRINLDRGLLDLTIKCNDVLPIGPLVAQFILSFTARAGMFLLTGAGVVTIDD